MVKEVTVSFKNVVKSVIGFVTKKISDCTPKKYNLAIVVIAKNEQDYIKEWVAFHKVMGGDKIILYDNDSTDNMVNEIKPFINEGYVIYNKIPGEKQQLNAYNDALKRYSSLFRYMAFIDCDEFLFPVDSSETVLSVVEKTMKKYQRAGGVCVNWVMYGSSGHETKPDGLLIENFIYRSKVPGRGTGCIKTICNPDLVIRFNHSHYPIYKRGTYGITPDGKKCSGWRNNINEYVGLRINHYFTKSKEQWIERRKFDVLNPQNLRTLDDYYAYDNNDILDKEILRYKEALCQIMNNNDEAQINRN